MLFKMDILTKAYILLDLEEFSGIRAFFELRKRQFLNGPLTRVSEIAYPKFELDDVAKSFLPLNRLDAGKGRNPSQRGTNKFFF